MKKNAYYIVTIHNKQDLIRNVIDGIISSTKDSNYNTNIVCVLDGCTDDSEKIIDSIETFEDIKIHKIYENDVHELLSINSAFRFITKHSDNKKDLIFILQDDVVLQQENLNETIEYLYESNPKLGYISFRCGLSTTIDPRGLLYEYNFVESEDGHWKQLNLDHFLEMKNEEFGFCEIVIKSPTVIRKDILDEVGFFDENLAPYGHDDLDLCIRLNILGYKNAVYGAKFTSKLDWGGTRESKNQEKDYHKQYDNIIVRNKIYLTNKHKQYYEAKSK